MTSGRAAPPFAEVRARGIDDTPAVIANRIRVYERDTVPLLAYYARRATVIHIDGARPEREVTDAVLRELAACA